MMFSVFDRLIAHAQRTKKGQTQQIWFFINCGTIPEKIHVTKKKWSKNGKDQKVLTYVSP